MECQEIQGPVEMEMEEDQPEPVVVKELNQLVVGHESPAVKAVEKGFEEISKAVVVSEVG